MIPSDPGSVSSITTPGNPVVFLADPETNTTYSRVEGVISLKITRAASCTPASLEFQCTYDPVLDSSQGSVIPISGGGNSSITPVNFDSANGGAFKFVIDSGYAYVLLTQPAGCIISKIDITTMISPATSVNLGLAATATAAMGIDSDGIYLYVASRSSRGKLNIVKLLASNLSIVASVETTNGDYPFDQGNCQSVCAGSSYVYIGCSFYILVFDFSLAFHSAIQTNGADKFSGSIVDIKAVNQNLYTLGLDNASAQAVVGKYGISSSAPNIDYISSAHLDPSALYPSAFDVAPNGLMCVAVGARAASFIKIIKIDYSGTNPIQYGFDPSQNNDPSVYDLNLPLEDGPISSLFINYFGDGFLYALHDNLGLSSPTSVDIINIVSAPVPSTSLTLSGYSGMKWLQISGDILYMVNSLVPGVFIRMNPHGGGGGTIVSPGNKYNRFYPYLKVIVVESGSDDNPLNNVNSRKYFHGKIDTAILAEDGINGRVWKINARDYLSVLADNFIDKGVWNNIPSWRGVSRRDGDPYIPSYTDDSLSYPIGSDKTGESHVDGERRQSIISDLCVNIVNRGSIVGIQGVDISMAPNSRRIISNWKGSSQVSILDAIKDLAKEDPWFTTNLPISSSSQGVKNIVTQDPSDLDMSGLYSVGGSVDTVVLSNPTYTDGHTAPPFPIGSGIGGELQIKCDTLADSGQRAVYYARGLLRADPSNTNMVFSYGPGSNVTANVLNILEYNFGKDGTDVFSRSRVMGGGDATSLGIPTIVDSMETTWSPLNGLFQIRRETPLRSQGISGKQVQATGTLSGNNATEAREANDSSYASLISGNPGLSRTRGGADRGTITVHSAPNKIGGVVNPGTIIEVYIPHSGIYDPLTVTGGQQFTIESWTYNWPETITTYEISRLSYASLTQQLLSNFKKASDSAAGLTTAIQSPWVNIVPLVSGGGGTYTFHHGLGYTPSHALVQAGSISFNGLYWNNFGAPDSRSVKVVESGFDPQGIPTGRILNLDNQDAVVYFQENVVIGPDGNWYKLSTGDVVVKVTVFP